MKVTKLGSEVGLSSGPKTVRDDGPTGHPTMQLVGSQVDLSRMPVNDFRPEAGKATFQLLGEKADLNRNPVAGYDGASLSTRASKQQGSGR